MYRCKHFKIHELVPHQVYVDRREKAWSLLDDRALRAIDFLRDLYGPITINNWYWGGQFKDSGLRVWDSTVGSKYSQHRFGRGFDLKFRHISADSVRKYLLKTKNIPYITALELDTDSWLHIDCRNNNTGKILTFSS